jgi:pyruvate dehydrogenase E1 component alpha subunit
VLENDLISESELIKIDNQAKEMVEDAVRFAEESPLPAPEDCLTDVYVNYPREGVRL